MSRPPALAVLQAGDTETLYRRAGDGPPVLLLCTGALADPLGGRLFERLAMSARVVAPILPATGDLTAVLADWLDEVTEGLGLLRPSLVIDEALAAALLDGEIAPPERFAGVIVAIGSGGDARDRATLLAAQGAHVVEIGGDGERADATAVAAAMLPHLRGR